jgi:hypothetical protein
MIKEEKKVANAENVAVPQSKPEKEMSPVGQNNTTTQQTPAPAIDPAIQNAIQQAVAGAVQMIMAQMTQPTGNQPSLNVAQGSQWQSSGVYPSMRVKT